MAGMPLFAHAGREKLTPPPLSVPLKPIKFCGFKTPNALFKVLRRRTGLGFACLLRKTGKNARKAAVLSIFFCMFRFCLCVVGFREKLANPPKARFPPLVSRRSALNF